MNTATRAAGRAAYAGLLTALSVVVSDAAGVLSASLSAAVKVGAGAAALSLCVTAALLLHESDGAGARK